MRETPLRTLVSLPNRLFVWLGVQLVALLDKLIGEENRKQGQIRLAQWNAAWDHALYGWINPDGKYARRIYQIYRFFYRSLGAVAAYIFLLHTNFLWLMGGMPGVEDLQNPKMAQASAIFSADGVEIGSFFAENRIPVDSAQIARPVFEALIATEDARFFEHAGIDLTSMGGVALGLLQGGERGGGSTISQQLAKNLYNTRKKEMRGLLYYIPGVRTVVYKSKEWITAIQLEKRFTKGEIITMYLNTVSYGNNAYGIKTAAKTFFDKEPKDLLIQEAAVLVGLQKATTYYNPVRNPERSKNRRNVVIRLMEKHGFVSSSMADSLVATPLVINENTGEEEKETQGNYGYLKSAIARFIEQYSEKNELDIDLYRDGLRIVTTVDSRIQDMAEQSMWEHMKGLQKEFEGQWGNKNPWVFESGDEIPGFIDTVAKRTTYYKRLDRKFEGNPDSIAKYMNLPMPMKLFSYEGTKSMVISHMDSLRYYKKILQCGLVSMDPYNGQIVAWVGGIDYDHFQYDHVKQAKRQPGSTFKPVVYTAAIDGEQNLSPCFRIEDYVEPREIEENGVKKIWQPRNANGVYSRAQLTLRTALARSVNSVAVQLTDKVGPSIVAQYARKLGIQSPMKAVASIGLGTSDVSLLEMVSAYSPFVNNGRRAEPIFIKEIQDRNGKVLVSFELKEEPEQVISEESAFLMRFMLQGNVEEPGATGLRMRNYSAIFQNGGEFAGKTGTTSNNSDAWYIGFNKDLVTGAWVGGDDRSIHFRSSMGEGSRSALPMVGLFLDKLYRNKELGYKAGKFKKPTFETTKPYADCAYYDSYGEENNDSDSSVVELDSLGRRFDVDSIQQNTDFSDRFSPKKEAPDSSRRERAIPKSAPIISSPTPVGEENSELSRRELRKLRREERRGKAQ